MYQLIRTQFIPASQRECWDFFSSPHNLKKITPEFMGFEILNNIPDNMYEGMMISYKIKPLLGLTFRWVTEIKNVQEGTFFVDDQRVGPYKIWHHEHHFAPVDNGVEMHDIVSYEMPFGVLGRFVHELFVRKKIEAIFDYREQAIKQIFK